MPRLFYHKGKWLSEMHALWQASQGVIHHYGVENFQATPIIPQQDFLRSLTPLGGKLGAWFNCHSIKNCQATPIIPHPYSIVECILSSHNNKRADVKQNPPILHRPFCLMRDLRDYGVISFRIFRLSPLGILRGPRTALTP